jgi:hypothetical protein
MITEDARELRRQLDRAKQRPLDVAGEWFGQAGVVLDAQSATAQEPQHVSALLRVMCETIDCTRFERRESGIE